MRESKFTEAQTVSILKKLMRVVLSTRSGGSTASAPPPSTCGKPDTAGLEASEIKRLKELEHENDRLKRMYTDLLLEIEELKQENGYVEAFNGKFRDELLNGELFYTLHEAQCSLDAVVGTTTPTAHIARWGIGHPPHKPAPSHRSVCRRD